MTNQTALFKQPEMSADEFSRLVSEMRSAQRRYFLTRDKDWLAKSKGLEARVDAELTLRYANMERDLK